MDVHEQTADVLERAAMKIEKDGWYQGNYYPGWLGVGMVMPVVAPQGVPVCAEGAIATVCGGQHTTTAVRARQALEKSLPSSADMDICPCCQMSIPLWNDYHKRTKQEVLDAFQLAAKQERMLAVGQ